MLPDWPEPCETKKDEPFLVLADLSDREKSDLWCYLTQFDPQKAQLMAEIRDGLEYSELWGTLGASFIMCESQIPSALAQLKAKLKMPQRKI